MIEISQTVIIPDSDIEISAIRSQGAGGQNVNKLNTKAEIRFNIESADWIPNEVKQRLIQYQSNKINKDGELLITSWCEDPDLLSFTNQLKLVDKELDTVLLNYSFTSNGSFGKKKGKYNNMMFWFIGCEWSAEGDYTMKMKYHFTQEEYDDGE
jgi:hypothetical protein